MKMDDPSTNLLNFLSQISRWDFFVSIIASVIALPQFLALSTRALFAGPFLFTTTKCYFKAFICRNANFILHLLFYKRC